MKRRKIILKLIITNKLVLSKSDLDKLIDNLTKELKEAKTIYEIYKTAGRLYQLYFMKNYISKNNLFYFEENVTPIVNRKIYDIKNAEYKDKYNNVLKAIFEFNKLPLELKHINFPLIEGYLQAFKDLNLISDLECANIKKELKEETNHGKKKYT